jgi:hypothetical protein
MLIWLGLLMLAGCRTAPIYESRGIAVPSNFTKEDTRKIIVRTIQDRSWINRGWYLQEAMPDRVRVNLDLRSHHAVVDILYDEKTIRPVLVSSENLDEHDGVIHKHFNEWMENLEKDIRIQIGEEQAKRELK